MIATILFSVGMNAQNTPETAAVDNHVEVMVTELGLSDKQATQYRQMLEENRTELKTLREAEREGLSEKANALKAQQEARLKEILSDEQWAKYQARIEKMQAKSIERVEKIKQAEKERLEKQQAAPEKDQKLKNSINGN